MLHEEPKKPRKSLFARLKNRSEINRKRQAERAPAEAPETVSDDPMALCLAPDHPVMRLWQKTPELPQPVFSLAAPPSPGVDGGAPRPLTDPEGVPDELRRLEQLIQHSAERRLTMIEMDAPGEGGMPDEDAEVHLFMTAQHVSAWMFVYPPVGNGRPLDAGMIDLPVRGGHLRYGLDRELIERLPGLPDRYFKLFLIARGDPPLHGRDGYVEDLFPRTPPKPFSTDASGAVDFSTLELFHKVQKGDVICRIYPSTPCRDGKSVRGEIAYARGGQPAQIPRGRNTELSEDGSLLLAACEGHVEFSGRSFQVKPVMDLQGNVDATSGNVSALGDIHIHGDVCSGFSVRATGSVTIDGTVESASVEAGGDLIVRNGVQGNSQAVLRSHRNVYVRYMESCSVYARENVEAECIVNCDVFSDGSVTVRSGRGKIMGGRVRAAKQVSADVIGSRSEMATYIAIGGKPFEDFERDMLEMEIRDLEKEIVKAERQRGDPRRSQQLSKMRLQVSADRMKLEQLEKTLAKLEGAAPARGGRMLGDVVHAGVEIAFGSASHKVRLERNMCTATLLNGEVVLN